MDDYLAAAAAAAGMLEGDKTLAGAIASMEEEDGGQGAGGEEEEGEYVSAKSSVVDCIESSGGRKKVVKAAAVANGKNGRQQPSVLNVRRLKLDTFVSAQLDCGSKLTLSVNFTSSSPTQSPSPHVQLFSEGLQRLLNHWEEIYMALCLNSHYTCCLEQMIDIDDNQMNYVLLEVDTLQRAIFYHTFINRLSASRLTSPATNIYYRSAYTQAITVSKSSMEKLIYFLRTHVSKEVKKYVLS